MQTLGLCPDLLKEELGGRGLSIFVLTNYLGGSRITALVQQKEKQKNYKSCVPKAMDRNIGTNTPRLI